MKHFSPIIMQANSLLDYTFKRGYFRAKKAMPNKVMHTFKLVDHIQDELRLSNDRIRNAKARIKKLNIHELKAATDKQLSDLSKFEEVKNCEAKYIELLDFLAQEIAKKKSLTINMNSIANLLAKAKNAREKYQSSGVKKHKTGNSYKSTPEEHEALRIIERDDDLDGGIPAKIVMEKLRRFVRKHRAEKENRKSS